MYKVIKYFTDLQDSNHPYNEGDVYPRNGITVTEKRLAELAGSNNKRKEPLIALVEEQVVEAESADAEKQVDKAEIPKKAAREAPAKKSAGKTEKANE